MVHLDVKKVGRIPDGGGWRIHGKGTDAHRASRRKDHPGEAGGYVFLHSALNGFSRLAYTEAQPDEKGPTAVGFLARARVFLAAHGIHRITRLDTRNGACCQSEAFGRAVGRQRSEP